jgi:hypothetical protein
MNVRYSLNVEETGKVRKLKRTSVADSNTAAGLLLGVLCCWFISVIGSAGPNLGFYYTKPYYFSAAGRYTLNPSGPGAILLALACLWLLYLIFKRGLFGGLIFATVIVLLGAIFLTFP